MVNSIWATAKEKVVVKDSVVDFPTKTRLHIALNVRNVNGVVDFYRLLFGKEPHTQREGYIKFDLVEPPLNISLNEVPKNAKGNGNFGMQAKDVHNFSAIEARLRQEGVELRKDETCIRGFKVKDPEGNEWFITPAKM